MALGMNRLQSDAVSRFLSASQKQDVGRFLNALMTGVVETFDGKILQYNDTSVTTFRQTGIDKDLEPYFVYGANQILSIRSSDTTAVADAGIFDTASATARGILRLSTNDTNAAGAMALTQENVLWIPGGAAFNTVFDINNISNINRAVAVSFAEVGVMGDQATIANITDSSKEPGDGNPFIAVKFYNGQGVLRVRTAASATVLQSGFFTIPSVPFTLTLEYGYNSQAGTGSTSVKIDGNVVGVVAGTVTGPLQVFARACRGASYLAASHVPAQLDIDTVLVSVPRE